MTPADPPPATQVLEALWRYFAPPPDAPPTDELEALVDRFVELKQRLGAKYQSQWRVLFRFLRHMESRGIIHVQQLTPEILRDWADSRRHLAPTTFDHEIRQVCVLLDHFKTLGKIKDNPAEFLKVRIRHNHVPYVFALEELARIFVPAGAGRFDEDHALIWRFTYACGLRAQEAAHLGIGDFDPGARTVFIRRSKFGKDRLLPVHPRIAERLADHLARRRRGAPADEPVFLGAQRVGYHPASLSRLFKQHLVRLGIYRRTHEVNGLRHMSPRLHSLRHSFAVHRVLQWYREGADVQAKLPLLSTYLGHSSVEHTQVYLKITAVLLREAAHRFSTRLEGEFPLSP